LGTIYPKENRHLAERRVAENGCLISEYVIGTVAARARLIARDRLQSALASAVIVMQAGVDGGTLYTARFALQQGKRLFVLEAPPRSTPSWAGNVFLTDPDPVRLNLRPKIRFPNVPTPYGQRMALSEVREAVRAMLMIP
jgi:DNA processing protein